MLIRELISCICIWKCINHPPPIHLIWFSFSGCHWNYIFNEKMSLKLCQWENAFEIMSKSILLFWDQYFLTKTFFHIFHMHYFLSISLAHCFIDSFRSHTNTMYFWSHFSILLLRFIWTEPMPGRPEMAPDCSRSKALPLLRLQLVSGVMSANTDPRLQQ